MGIGHEHLTSRAGTARILRLTACAIGGALAFALVVLAAAVASVFALGLTAFGALRPAAATPAPRTTARPTILADTAHTHRA